MQVRKNVPWTEHVTGGRTCDAASQEVGRAAATISSVGAAPLGRLHWLVFLVTGLCGACLTAYAPDIRAVEHHEVLPVGAPDALCMSCHEAEKDVLERLQALEPRAREAEMERIEAGGGASLVAQWMIEDPRTCIDCHRVRGAGR